MILYSNLKEFEMCSNPYCVLAAVGCCAAFFVCLSCESALGQNLPGGVNAIRKLVVTQSNRNILCLLIWLPKGFSQVILFAVFSCDLDVSILIIW